MRKEVLDIILENRKRHEGKTDSELLDYAIQVMQDQITGQIIEAGQEIQDGGRKLEMLKASSQLIGFSTHFMGSAETIIEEDYQRNPTDIMKSYLQTTRFKREILQMSKPKILKILTKEAQTKYFKEEQNEQS